LSEFNEYGQIVTQQTRQSAQRSRVQSRSNIQPIPRASYQSGDSADWSVGQVIVLILVGIALLGMMGEPIQHAEENTAPRTEATPVSLAQHRTISGTIVRVYGEELPYVLVHGNDLHRFGSGMTGYLNDYVEIEIEYRKESSSFQTIDKRRQNRPRVSTTAGQTYTHTGFIFRSSSSTYPYLLVTQEGAERMRLRNGDQLIGRYVQIRIRYTNSEGRFDILEVTALGDSGSVLD